jgi:hypothetical protein
MEVAPKDPSKGANIMINATEQIKQLLKEQAHEESRPFCYGDYITVAVDEAGNAFCPNPTSPLNTYQAVEK